MNATNGPAHLWPETEFDNILTGAKGESANKAGKNKGKKKTETGKDEKSNGSAGTVVQLLVMAIACLVVAGKNLDILNIIVRNLYSYNNRLYWLKSKANAVMCHFHSFTNTEFSLK